MMFCRIYCHFSYRIYFIVVAITDWTCEGEKAEISSNNFDFIKRKGQKADISSNNLELLIATLPLKHFSYQLKT